MEAAVLVARPMGMPAGNVTAFAVQGALATSIGKGGLEGFALKSVNSTAIQMGVFERVSFVSASIEGF